jgi:ABC-type transporter Mla subunit MlaD
MEFDNAHPFVLVGLFAWIVLYDFLLATRIRKRMGPVFATWEREVKQGFEGSKYTPDQALTVLERNLAFVEGVAKFEKFQVVGPLFGVFAGAYTFSTIESVTVPALKPLAFGVGLGSICALLHVWFAWRVEEEGAKWVREGLKTVDEASRSQPIMELGSKAKALASRLDDIDEGLPGVQEKLGSAAGGIQGMLTAVSQVSEQVREILQNIRDISGQLVATQTQAVETYRGTGDRVEKAIDGLERAIGDVGRVVADTVRSISRVGDDLKRRMDQNDDSFDESRTMLEDAARAVAGLRDLIRTMKEHHSGFVEWRAEFAATLQDGIRTPIEDLERAVEKCAETLASKSGTSSSYGGGPSVHSAMDSDVVRSSLGNPEFADPDCRFFTR